MSQPRVYEDPLRYELLAQMTAPDDLGLWRALAAEAGGPVLELGCGTGRVTLPLAEAGFEIVGLDRSQPLVEYAAARAAERGVGVTLAVGDMRDFELGARFRLVIAPWNAFHHLLDLASIEAFFAAARRHLDEGGRLVVDAFQPSPAFLGAAPERRRILRYRDPYAEREVHLFEENEYDTATQINRVRWWFESDGAEPERDELEMRIVFPQELEALVRLGGLRVLDKWGGYDRAPFTSRSPKQIVVLGAG